MAQQSIGGPPGVPVTLHGSNGPRVRLKCDPSCRGRVVRQGPSQSIVRWNNGNEDCVVNTWIEPDKDGVTTTIEQDIRTGHASQQDVDAHRACAPNRDEAPAPKPRREPDALALRVAELDDAGLKAFALANGCWDDKYLQLSNNGLRRMNVMNRLRAKIKREPEYKIKW